MLINLKTVCFILFLITIGFAEQLNINTLNRYIYSSIEYSSDVEHHPEKTDIETKKAYLAKDTFDPKIRFINNTPIDHDTILKLHSKRNLDHIIPENRYGFTKKRTNIKMFPTESTLQHNINDRIDRNQYSLVEPFEPLVILHESIDKKWYYIQTFYTRGWIKADYIQETSYEHFKNYFKMKKLTVITDRIDISGITFGFGSRIPLIKESEDHYTVVLPDLTHHKIRKSNNLAIYPVSYDPKFIKDFLESIIGQPYDWGGKSGFRDCSSLVMDIFRIFGINLPRNSKQQALVGITLWEKGKGKNEFLSSLDKADPFCTLMHMKGHIIIYGGKENNDYTIYHAVERLNNVNYNSVVKQHIISDNIHLWEKAYKITTICPYIKRQSY